MNNATNKPAATDPILFRLMDLIDRTVFNAVCVATAQFDQAGDELRSAATRLDRISATISRAAGERDYTVNSLGEMQAVGSQVDAACGKRENARASIAFLLPIVRLSAADVADELDAAYGIR